MLTVIDWNISKAALSILSGIGLSTGRQYKTKGRFNAGGIHLGSYTSFPVVELLFDMQIPLMPGLYLILFYPPALFVPHFTTQQFTYL